MSDVIVSYKGSPIIDLSVSGSKTIKTAGKYCEADLSLQYTKPSGGGAFILITSTKGATLTADDQTYTLTGDETEHAFAVSLGTYVCTASKDGNTKSETVVVSTETVYKVGLILGRLPAGYQEVEYLSSTENGPFIETGVGGDDVDFVFHGYLSANHSGNPTFFGNFQSNTGVYLWHSATALQLGFGSQNISSDGRYSGDITASKEGNVFNLNGANRAGSYALPATYKLFRLGNREDVYSGEVRVYFAQFLHSTLQNSRNFIPCYRGSDNKPGMYDLAGSICPLTNSPFYINAGSGEFIAGPDVI